MRMEPTFEKANEIYFRLGIIYKQQQKFAQSLECFRYIVNDPPRPLSEEDIWFQVGHVHEQQKDVSQGFVFLRMLGLTKQVRRRKECVQARPRPRPESRQSLAAIGMATSPAEHKL